MKYDKKSTTKEQLDELDEILMNRYTGIMNIHHFQGGSRNETYLIGDSFDTQFAGYTSVLLKEIEE